MKTKSFQEYLEKRLSKDENASIEAQAVLGLNILIPMQKAVSHAKNIKSCRRPTYLACR